MLGKLSSHFSQFLDTKPTPPVPFGYKMGWIAVRSTDINAVVGLLPVRSQRTASWHDGIEAAYKGGSVFITPPVNGWLCIVGDWAAGFNDQHPVELIEKRIIEISSRFREAHAYATHRVVEYHHWMMAREGRIIRCFAYMGESGEVLCNIGSITDAERNLSFSALPTDQWIPDEQDVLTVASGWSFDPSQLSRASAPAALGIIARLK